MGTVAHTNAYTMRTESVVIQLEGLQTEQ